MGVHVDRVVGGHCHHWHLGGYFTAGSFKAKAAAYKTVCLNNQRQIGITRQLYANDHDSFLIHGAINWWQRLSFFYLDGQTNLFNCPSEKRVLKILRAAGWSGGPLNPPWRHPRYGRPFLPLGYMQNDSGLARLDEEFKL